MSLSASFQKYICAILNYSHFHTGRKDKKIFLCKYYIEKADVVLFLNDKSKMSFNANSFQKRTYNETPFIIHHLLSVLHYIYVLKGYSTFFWSKKMRNINVRSDMNPLYLKLILFICLFRFIFIKSFLIL